MNQSEAQHQADTIEAHRKALAVLHKQLGTFGMGRVPPHVATDIQHRVEEIARIRRILSSDGWSVDQSVYDELPKALSDLPGPTRSANQPYVWRPGCKIPVITQYEPASDASIVFVVLLAERRANDTRLKGYLADGDTGREYTSRNSPLEVFGSRAWWLAFDQPVFLNNDIQ